MESGLFFHSGTHNSLENDFLACEVLGRYLELLDNVHTRLFQKTFWSTYSTFTREEWTEDLEDIIDKDSLPEKPNLFEPDEGIHIITNMKTFIQADKDYRESFNFYGKNDYQEAIQDFDKIKTFFEKAKKENQKWYLSVVAEY